MAEASQLMPMIGTATSAHETVCEQPSDAFSAEVQTSKPALPLPSRPVTPNVSLLGKFELFETFCASGG